MTELECYREFAIKVCKISDEWAGSPEYQEDGMVFPNRLYDLVREFRDFIYGEHVFDLKPALPIIHNHYHVEPAHGYFCPECHGRLNYDGEVLGEFRCANMNCSSFKERNRKEDD